MFLIEELNGDRQLVTSLDGIGDAKVVNDDVPEPPSDWHFLDEAGVWVLDEQAEHDGLLAAAHADKDALIAELSTRLAEMEATMMVLVPIVEQSTGLDIGSGELLA